MEPIRRNANRMLDTLTGKIPEKLSQENSFAPLPTLEEMDNASHPASSSSFIQNNWLAILATLLLIMFTVFNVLAYYSQKGESSDKMFNDAYKYVNDSLGLNQQVEKEEASIKKVKVSNQIQNINSGKSVGKLKEKEEEEEEEEDSPNTLDTALANASQKKGDSSYKANDAHSSVNTIKAKAGWCFVGEEKGFRNCVEVGENDKCLSGDIFPTSQVCVNPSLRA